jgi:hypothetical protein
MKRTFTCMIILLFALYFSEGIRQFAKEEPVQSIFPGNLSDIAKEVTAIQLEATSHCQVKQAEMIRKDGNDLFLVSKQQLYHFNCKGKFLNQITFNRQNGKNNSLLINDYVIDPIHKQLIVLDEKQNAHYFTYNGDFLGTKNLNDGRTWNSLIHLSYFDHHIWATAERSVVHKNQGRKVYMEQWLYKFDTTFQTIEAQKISPVKVGRINLERSNMPEMAVSEGQVYVAANPTCSKELLEDTLCILQRNDTYRLMSSTVYPWHIGSRFLITSSDDFENYTFCFDKEKKLAYNKLNDDFYNSGTITDLHAIDVYSDTYFFSKSHGNNCTIYIVKLQDTATPA